MVRATSATSISDTKPLAHPHQIFLAHLAEGGMGRHENDRIAPLHLARIIIARHHRIEHAGQRALAIQKIDKRRGEVVADVVGIVEPGGQDLVDHLLWA